MECDIFLAIPHAMDCTDMIIGSARGMRSRIGDYYSRDRSTPLHDEAYGGTESLTAAVGFEEDGYTTILFRKKLQAAESVDFSITNSFMHVIWARGQDAGNYVHVPPTGIDGSTTASDPNYYKVDELKYHGHASHRGVRTLNFMLDTETDPVMTTPAPPLTCEGTWGNCNTEDSNCYLVRWSYNDSTGLITFTVRVYLENNQWAALGFSRNTQMAATDVVVGYVRPDGKGVLQDRYAEGKFMPSLDSSSDVNLVSSSRQNKITTFEFTRPPRTADTSHDFQFSSTNCAYFFYAKGGTFTNNGDITRHDQTPIISQERICIPCAVPSKSYIHG
ncbi:hypothetical protein FSP39_016057 [Pinctada imbricata]|uniref:DOMON domain-containing protein n=1 Tax=Pinctada imbricata TaxID=66713 RepID=A0AA88XSM2_PINIB|nr:hypothetical protein FSP39_016057 [Pinctada imbricata]